MFLSGINYFLKVESAPESNSVVIQIQNHADRFLRYQRHRDDLMGSRGSNCEPKLLFDSFGNIARMSSHSSTRTRVLLTRVGTLRLLLVSEDKVCLKRNPVLLDGRGETKIGGTPEWSYENRLPALPRAMEETNETACEEGRRVY
ncbi:Hypothetical protein CINCED_3A015377 [Cinara cedri]|uniref:Uncharacterized protein n=1 Tax=Cinara cedri TaxID=506608 RepID=A0A5E4N716_9HEMI|nr:Hypothetical protein CINCED_3A015377 [Cinara cedri]